MNQCMVSVPETWRGERFPLGHQRQTFSVNLQSREHPFRDLWPPGWRGGKDGWMHREPTKIECACGREAIELAVSKRAWLAALV